MCTTSYPEYLLEHARRLDVVEFEDYTLYSNTPEEERSTLGANARSHYEKVKNLLDIMVSYGTNQWWALNNSENLNKKLRVYFQVFDCGLDTMLITKAQLANDLNDLIGNKDVVITTWMLRHHRIFFGRHGFYTPFLLTIFEGDEEFQNTLRSLQNAS